MTDEQIYLFDLRGYIVLEGAVPQSLIDAANDRLDTISAMAPGDYPPPVTLGQPRTPENLFISNIIEADPVFQDFMDLPAVLDVISHVTGGPSRLNHTYFIERSGAGYTSLHMGNTPLRHNCQYRCQNGTMFSPLTKAVFPLLPATAADGCFAAIPGSHKSGFPRPWGNHPEENPPLEPITANPGDALVFTEAMTHGSTVNTSGRLRRTLYYCYSLNWMPDWGNQGLHFSRQFAAGLSAARADLIAVANGAGAIEPKNEEQRNAS